MNKFYFTLISFMFLLSSCDVLRVVPVRNDYYLKSCPTANFEIPQILLRNGWELQREQKIEKCSNVKAYHIAEEQTKMSEHKFPTLIYVYSDFAENCKITVVNKGYCYINEPVKHCLDRLNNNESDREYFYKYYSKASNAFIDLLELTGLPPVLKQSTKHLEEYKTDDCNFK